MEHAISKLPVLVQAEFSRMEPSEQAQFFGIYDRKRRSRAVAYLASLLYLHYAYLGRVGMTVLMWIVAICSFGIVGLLWWIVDLFRMPSLVADRNSDIAVEVMRDQKIISGAR